MGNKIRLLLIVTSFGFLAFLISRTSLFQISKVKAVPGTLQLGSQTTSTTYVNNDATYNSNLNFGGVGGRGGVLKSDGTVLIMPTGTPSNLNALVINDRTKTDSLSVGTGNNTKKLEVAGDSNFQGNVGMGVGAPSTLATPLTVHSNTAVTNLVTLEGTATNVTHLGVDAGRMTMDTNITVGGTGTSIFGGNLNVNGAGANTLTGTLTVNGAGNSSFAGNLGVGTTAPTNKLQVSGNGYLTGDVTAAGGDLYLTASRLSDSISASYLNIRPQANRMIMYDGTNNMTFDIYNGATRNVHLVGSGDSFVAGGKLGVGTATPTEQMSVTGNSVVTGQMAVGTTGLDGQMRVFKNSGAGGRNNLVLTNGTPVAAGVTKSSVLQFKDANNALQMEMGNDRGVNGTNDFYIYDGVAAADRMYIASNGKVGFGTTAPGAKVDTGPAIAGLPALNVSRAGSQPSIKSTSDWLIMDSNTQPAALNYFTAQPVVLAQGGGNVGIGTTAPSSRLQVYGNIAATGWVGAGCEGSCETSGGYALMYADGHTVSSANVQSPIYYDLNDTGYYVDPNGNSRMANAYFNSALINWPGYNGLTQAYANYIWPGRNDGSGANWQQSWYLASNSSYGLYTNTGMYFAGATYMPIMYDINNTGYYIDPSSYSNIYFLTSTGAFIANFSIQNNTLDFNKGYQGLDYLYAGNGGAGFVFGGGFYCSNCLYQFGSTTGDGSRVGFGTQTPNSALHVMNDNALIELGNYHQRFAGQVINSCTGAAWAAGLQGGIYGRDYSTGCGDEWMVAWQSEDGAENSRLLILARNDANDDVFIRGTGGTTTGTGDLAEMYFSKDDLKLGEVVVNDHSSAAGVKRANSAYQNEIVGVTSARPFAIVMSQNEKVAADPNFKPISLAGKIIVRVSLENGPIKAGDPLTTSSTPGYAMKATKASMIIGRAFEDYDGSVQSSEGSERMYKDTGDGCGDCEKVLRIFPRTYKTLPGTYKTGSMVVSMGVMWWDPDMVMTASGDLKLAETVHGHEVRNANNDLISKVAGFAEIVAAKIQAGLIETKKLVVDGVDVLKKLNETEAQLKETKSVVETQQKQIEELQKAVKALQK